MDGGNGRNEIAVNVKYSEAEGRLHTALKREILQEMRWTPEKFALKILRDETYPDQFADHMIEKLRAGHIMAVNETTRGALYKVGATPTLAGLYDYVGMEGPEASQKRWRVSEEIKLGQRANKLEPTKVPSPKSKFKGC